MNKAREKSLFKAIAAFQEALSAAESDFETIRDEEQEYFDNMPESLQDSERGERASSYIEALEEVLSGISDLNDTISNLEGI
jgi:hypothetical protein